METFGAFLQKIFDNIVELIPFFFTRSYEKSVRWWLGKHPEALDDGIHVKVPWLHQVETIGVVDDVLELPIQSVMTKDRKLLCFSASIGYSITDPVKHFCAVQEFGTSVAGLTRAHLAEWVGSLTLDELCNDRELLLKKLRSSLHAELKDWGTRVRWVGFTNFAEVPTQVRMFGIGDHGLLQSA